MSVYINFLYTYSDMLIGIQWQGSDLSHAHYEYDYR